MGVFSPLVLSVFSGGMGPTAKVIYKKTATISPIARQLITDSVTDLASFCFVPLSCIESRGSCSSTYHPANPQLFEAAIDRAVIYQSDPWVNWTLNPSRLSLYLLFFFIHGPIFFFINLYHNVGITCFVFDDYYIAVKNYMYMPI